MDTTTRISNWIDAQLEAGKTREDLHGTVFVLATDQVGIIKKSGKKNFALDILLKPHVVDFTKEVDAT